MFGFREEQVQMVRKNGEERQVLAALALCEWIIVDQCQMKRKENQDVNQLTECATLKINETDEIKELYKVIGEFTESERKRNWMGNKSRRGMGRNEENQ